MSLLLYDFRATPSLPCVPPVSRDSLVAVRRQWGLILDEGLITIRGLTRTIFPIQGAEP